MAEPNNGLVSSNQKFGPFAQKSVASNDKSKIRIEVLDVDKEKIPIEKQNKAADISTNSGASWNGGATQDTEPVTGLVTKLETEKNG